MHQHTNDIAFSKDTVWKGTTRCPGLHPKDVIFSLQNPELMIYTGGSRLFGGIETMRWMMCFLLGILVAMAGCSDQEGSDSSQVSLPESEPVVLNLITAAPEAFEPVQANQIVFDMTYRGLSGPNDDFFFPYGYGYGGQDEDTPFIKDLKRHGIKNLRLVHNLEFKGAEISALEVSRKKPVAFYMDLDANGKVTANERITPLPSQDEDGLRTYFLTPDFSFKNSEDQQVCFRAMLNVYTHNGQDPVNWHWTPSCVLEGRTQVGDQQARLLLYPSGMSGDFDTFGLSDASLQIGETLTRKPDRSDLSRLWHANDRFYRLEIKHPEDNRAALRVVMTEDTSPTGQVKAQLTFKEEAHGKIQHALIRGATLEDNISLALPEASMALPIGTYRLDRGALSYGVDEKNQWQVDFTDGPVMTIKQGTENTVSLGSPTLALCAIDTKDRYRANPSTQTTYQKGTRIYLDRKVTGQAGESYGRFQRLKGRSRTDILAHITIANPKGKQILSKDLEYG